MTRLFIFIVGAALLAIILLPFAMIADTYTLNPPATPTLTIDQIKAQAIEPHYTDLARNTEQYTGKVVKYQGEVFQVVEDGNSYTMLINVTYMDYGLWEDTLMVTCRCDQRPLEGDQFLFYGTVTGRQTYETVLGAAVTVPLIKVELYDIAD